MNECTVNISGFPTLTILG